MVRSTDTLIGKACSQDSGECLSALVQGLASALKPAKNRRQADSTAIAELSIGSQVLFLRQAATVPGGSARRIARADRNLLRKSTLPVWLTRSDKLPRNIGVTLHPNALSGDHARLNQQLAGLARRMRDVAGATVHGITTWRAYGETLLGHRIAPEELTRYRDETRERAAHSARTALSDEDEMDANVQLHVVEGDLLCRIPEIISERSIDLLIVGNFARRGLPGLVVGNTVERLLPRVDCSVLAVPANVSPDERAAA